ncbi:MAG TPA: hypothetical protein VFI73_12120 [Candidatus Nitrosopolaris sp.]|nr:hypothetical protein [Candidatus Nitrosopolaris sp.]
MEIEQEQHPIGESNAYSLFTYAVRSRVTRDYYLRRLRIFFNYIHLLPDRTMEERCDLFAAKALKGPIWAFSSIVKFLQFQKRVEKEERLTEQLSVTL